MSKSAAAKEIGMMVDMLSIKDQHTAYEFVKRLLCACNPEIAKRVKVTGEVRLFSYKDYREQLRDPGFRPAYDTIDAPRFHFDNEGERAQYLSRRKFQMDTQHDFLAAWDEGYAEGRIKGKKEGVNYYERVE